MQNFGEVFWARMWTWHVHLWCVHIFILFIISLFLPLSHSLSLSIHLFHALFLLLSFSLSLSLFISLSLSLVLTISNSLPCLSKYTYIYLALWRAGINTESYFQCQQCEYKNKSKPIFHVPCVSRTSSKYYIYLYVYCICKENIQCVH